MFSKVIRKKVFAESEEGYFSYLELEGVDKSEPLVFFMQLVLTAKLI